MRDLVISKPLFLALAIVLCGLSGVPTTAADEGSSSLERVLEAVVANERELAETLERYRPLVETYLQTVKPDPVLGFVPVKDNYFFGRLELPDEDVVETQANGKKKARKRSKKNSLTLFDDFHSQTFKPESFARMLIVDRGAFTR